MLSLLKVLYGLTIIILLCVSLAAQPDQTLSTNSGPPPAHKRPAKSGAGREITPQQEQAILILNKLFESTKDFADDERRVKTQARIADTLWEYDPQNARRQFAEAFRSIERIEDEPRPLPFFDTPKTFLRLGVLDLIAKRDADLAEKLISDVPKLPANNDQHSPTRPQRGGRNHYLNLAGELISTDPQRAAALIPKAFNDGFSTYLLAALSSLRRKKPETADELFCRALAEIQPNPDAPMADLFAIAWYFAPDSEGAANHNANERKDGISAPTEVIKPILVEPLLNFAFKAVTIESANEQKRMTEPQRRKRMMMLDMIDAGIVAWLLPLFEIYQPERAAFIRSHLGQIENTIPPSVYESANTPRPTTVQGLLDAAQTKSKAFEKDMLYADAARKAEEAGDFDRALAITEKLSDKRMGMDVGLIRNSAVIHATDKGDVDAAYRYAKGISDPFDQTKALCRIARKSFEKSDLQRATELINEAEKIIAKSRPNLKKVFTLLDVASAITIINPAHGFEAVNVIIEVINQISSGKSQSDGMDFIRDSDTFDESLGALARADFQRALRLALAITDSDVSMLAQLAVCRGVLFEPKERRGESGKETKGRGRN
ncbi:MAG TPA: hypothetical protein VKE91_09150 [Blastocatellia bacterium]|nr:hypothetical protein [Blastocatellia bacterium]